MKRKFLAICVAALMLVSSVPVMAAAQHGNIGGVAGVDAPVINVVVPTSLDFSFDPFVSTARNNPDVENNQVVERNFVLINRTNADIAAIFNLTAEYDDTYVEIITRDYREDSTDFDYDGTYFFADFDADDKVLTLGVMGAYEITGGTTAATALSLAPETEITYYAFTLEDDYLEVGSGDYALMVEFDECDSSGDTVIAFGLELAAATGTIHETTGVFTATALAENNAGVGAFMFVASMNPYADWAEGDVTLSGTLMLTPLHPATNVPDIAGHGFFDASDLVITAPVVRNIGFASSGILENEGTVVSRTAATLPTANVPGTSGNLVIDFDLDNETPVIEYYAGGGSWNAVASTSYDAAGDTITIYDASLVAFRGLFGGVPNNRQIRFTVAGTYHILTIVAGA